jgi:polyvinyl alcohol dehydrogenase (cytochrome)
LESIVPHNARVGLVCLVSFLFAAAAAAQPPPPPSVTMTGQFDRRCAVCHDNPETSSRAPSREAMGQFSPDRVLAAITNGPMAVHAEGLREEQKRALAELVTGKPFGGSAARAAAAMPNRCATPLSLRGAFSRSVWNGWSPDPTRQWRFQPAAAAGLTADQVPRLRLRWAFGIPGAGSAAWSPVTVVGQTVFIGSDNNFVYALDARSGCVYWSFEAKRGVRAAVVIGEVKDRNGVRYGAYFGDQGANVYGVDAQTGALWWTVRADDHGSARITAAPVLDASRSRVIVPVASWEELSGPALGYPCCTFQGSLVALDLVTGKRAWKSYTMPERPYRVRQNSAKTQLYGPAGAAIWGSPTIDPKRNVIYAATGNAYIDVPDGGSSDAIIAFDLSTGKRMWAHQVLAGDMFQGGCGTTPEERRVNCPGQWRAPNDDISGSPILHDLPNGKSMLIVSQELGRIVALDPDRRGERIWTAQAGDAAGVNNAGWGGAFDGEHFYRPLAFPDNSGAVAALRAIDGQRVWYTKLEKPDCPAERNEGSGGPGRGACNGGNPASATAIPGVVFTGARSGIMRGYSTKDGAVVWEFDTNRPFETVNGVQANGGGFGGPGPTIIDGMVFTGSGYGGVPGNVLLAFGVD